MLVCAVQRDGEVYIPDGNFVPQPGDKINITASHPEIEKFLKLTKGIIGKAKNVMICGGGRVAYYLGSQLLELGMQVKIIEVDEKRCMELSRSASQSDDYPWQCHRSRASGRGRNLQGRRLCNPDRYG